MERRRALVLASYHNWLFGTDAVFSNKGSSERRDVRKWEGRYSKSGFAGAHFNIQNGFSLKILKKKNASLVLGTDTGLMT